MSIKRIRGYTTGVYAAAAAKGAAMALFSGRTAREVTVNLPRGGQARIPLLEVRVKEKAATCRVRKHEVEKGDVTAGALLVATVIRNGCSRVTVDGGRGVGVITRPGLQVAVGERAINPVPRRMIEECVMEAIRKAGLKEGCRVVISVPHGKKLAEGTLNARLGILGGISILGTTGIQVPYSTRAFLVSTEVALEVARARGNPWAVLCAGRRSETAARRYLALPDECFVLCGDHVGWALRRCARLGFAKILFWSMPAKMAKLAEGKANLNRRFGLPNLTPLLELAFKEGASPEDLRDHGCVNALLACLDPPVRHRVLTEMCRRAVASCERMAGGRLEAMTAVVSPDGLMEASWPPWPWQGLGDCPWLPAPSERPMS